jgi:hypothetical protein
MIHPALRMKCVALWLIHFWVRRFLNCMVYTASNGRMIMKYELEMMLKNVIVWLVTLLRRTHSYYNRFGFIILLAEPPMRSELGTTAIVDRATYRPTLCTATISRSMIAFLLSTSIKIVYFEKIRNEERGLSLVGHRNKGATSVL